MTVAALTARPLTRAQANAYIMAHHRHHKKVAGHRFIVAATLGGSVVGVMVAGRPRARLIDQYEHVEISRQAPARPGLFLGRKTRTLGDLRRFGGKRHGPANNYRHQIRAVR